MYLRELHIKNSGPLRELDINFAITEDDHPIPYVLVGENGSGKTNVLSIIADALIRAASTVFTNVVTPYAGSGQSYFRILGGRATTYGETGGFSILRFKDDGNDYFYRENSGDFSAQNAKEMISESLKPGVNWSVDQQGKQFNIPRELIREIFEGGIYSFFPSTRYEHPHWLNQDSLVEDNYDVEDRFSARLGKPIFVQHGLDRFAQWLLGVITDARMPVACTPDSTDPSKQLVRQNGPYNFSSIQTLELANDILRVVTADADAQFYWAGRNSTRKVGVASGPELRAVGLDSLSGGQATLLSIFGTLLRYTDMSAHGGAPMPTPTSVRGLAVIDELDAHMHVDLQISALPKLIAMFPKIQFIVSSHSPFFALGMEQNFGADGVRILGLPGGITLSGESYGEFGKALEALRKTQAFAQAVRTDINSSSGPIIWVSGVTDERYFRTAAQLLGYEDLVPYIKWIGARLPESANVYNTGDSALDAALTLLRANPEFVTRKIIFIYDCDANKTDYETSSIKIIALKQISGRPVEKGVENLLPPSSIPNTVYHNREITTGYNEKKLIQEFDKTALCDKICGGGAVIEDFRDFQSTLEEIRIFIGAAD